MHTLSFIDLKQATKKNEAKGSRLGGEEGGGGREGQFSRLSYNSYDPRFMG